MLPRLKGAFGETKAAKYLRKNKYEIIASGYYSRFGEIDLIAKKGNTIVFIEVTTRKDASFAKAFEFVDRNKIQKIKATAQIWMSQNDKDYDYRFDVIEIYTENDTLNHIENAF